MLSSRGSYEVKIKTINGSFDFAVNRYETSDGHSNWLRLTDTALSEHHESEMLQQFSLRYATMLSYERVSRLVHERCGNTKLSDQRIHHLVQEKAAAITVAQAVLIRDSQAESREVQAVVVDIYDKESEEVIWLSDGVCVSEQKAVRNKQSKDGKERTTTNIAMLERADGSYQTIIAGCASEAVSLYRAEVWREYGSKASQLPVVAISDGARSIKKETKQVFGEAVTHILDWYHLEAKVYQLMTHIAPNKKEKDDSNELLINALWKGETAKAIKHLQAIEAKNVTKQNELVGYLEKNKDYTIDYERRHKANKLIGSGRMEKQNDVMVSQRQKRKGMSWSKKGSLSLALVTAHLHSHVIDSIRPGSQEVLGHDPSDRSVLRLPRHVPSQPLSRHELEPKT